LLILDGALFLRPRSRSRNISESLQRRTLDNIPRVR